VQQKANNLHGNKLDIIASFVHLSQKKGKIMNRNTLHSNGSRWTVKDEAMLNEALWRQYHFSCGGEQFETAEQLRMRKEFLERKAEKV